MKDQVTNFSERSIQIIEFHSDLYPSKLKEVPDNKAPGQLYVWGNLELLNKPGVGFCGSRNVSEKGLMVAKDIAEQIAEQGWVTVSGHARGVDTVAHKTALENNAGTIVVLPQGIHDFKLRKELRSLATDENILFISEFPPDARWNVGYAMARNKTIISLSDAMVLIESRMEGGTFEAGETTLRLHQPLFVADYGQKNEHNAGNTYFIKKGAKRLCKSGESGRANIEALIQEVLNGYQRRSEKSAGTTPHQLSLL